MNRLGEIGLLLLGLLLGSAVGVSESVAQSEAAATEQAATEQGGAGTAVSSAASPSDQPQLVMDGHLIQLRRRAWQAAQRVDRFLQGGTAENAQRWKDFLEWPTLAAQLQPSATPDASELAKPLTALYSGEPGLELPALVELRETLMGYRRLTLYRSDQRIREAFDQEMEAAARDLFDPEKNRDYGTVAGQLEMMRQLNYAPEVVRAATAQYQHANLYLSASASMVSRTLTEPVSRIEPVNENILGTQICGTAHLQGQLTTRLLPSQDQALIQLCLTGVSNANTVGRQSPVTIYGSGVTDVLAHKTLCLDEVGIRAEPSTARCMTHSRIHSIRADNRLGKNLIEKIAWKKARQQQPQTERISSRRAEKRVTTSLDDQTLTRIADSNTRLRNRVRLPLLARNVFPRRLRFTTTQERLCVTATQGDARQLAAITPPPTCPPHGVVVQVHETSFLNTAINLIGGLHLTDERAVELIEEATGEVPEEFALKQDEDPWSITFDLDQPVRVNFGDNQVMIVIRGRRFTRGEQVVRQTIDIGATYNIEIHDGRAKLIRQGDVDVTYPGNPGRLSLTELRNKTFLTSKFAGLFKPVLGDNELQLPADMQDLSRLKNLRLDFALAHDGWLTLGWN